ncbi:MAG: S-layer homology domain-containing protein, partial [Oscillospiraceae bacterium]
MKSLNRTLSLVLVLVMVLGLVGISAGASFKDEAKINYKEAVGVMTGIGALVGYPDGTFNGAGTVTREEAVKTVVYAVLGADIAKTLAGTATGFADVDAGRWSSGVIAYAVSRGIINGRDAKTFDPTGNVTANEVGKMMLCAAGYGAKGEFIGSSWELNTAVLANKVGLFADSKAANHSTPATREETALYVFNGIQVEQVEYNKVFGSYISNKGLNIDATTIMQDVYSTTLSGRSILDASGAPSTRWTFKGKEIGTYNLEATYTFTKNMNTVDGKKELTATFKNFAIGDLDTSAVGSNNYIHLNGAKGTELTAQNLVDELAKVTADGRTVRVFVPKNHTNTILSINAIDTEL